MVKYTPNMIIAAAPRTSGGFGEIALSYCACCPD